MNKKRVIFENEEEFDISFRFFMNVSFNDSYEIILNDAKKAGLIRKNPVEEAEALYKKEIELLKQQKAELMEFIKDIVDYEAERVLREREILLNKYK